MKNKLSLANKLNVQDLIFNKSKTIDEIATELGFTTDSITKYCDQLLRTLSDIISVRESKVEESVSVERGPSHLDLFARTTKDGKSSGIVVMTPAASQRGDTSTKKSSDKRANIAYSPKTGKIVDI